MDGGDALRGERKCRSVSGETYDGRLLEWCVDMLASKGNPVYS